MRTQLELLLIPHDCTSVMKAQLIRTGLVLWSSIRDFQFTQNCPASVFSLYIALTIALQSPGKKKVNHPGTIGHGGQAEAGPAAAVLEVDSRQ